MYCNSFFNELLAIRLVFLLSASIGISNSFNLDFTPSLAKYITSPSATTVKPEDSEDAKLNAKEASFFGYELNVLKPTSSEPRLVIGSPNMMTSGNRSDRNGTKSKKGPRGAVYSCSITAGLFKGNPTTCNPAHPPGSQPGDKFGSSIASKSDGNMIQCSPTREQACIGGKYSPGYCFKSSDFGDTWQPDGNTQVLTCPENTVDVLFVLDGSGSVSGHFPSVKQWVKDISRQLNMESRQVRIGVVQYSHYWAHQDIQAQSWIKTEIEIGKFSSYKRFSAAVDRIKLQNFTTYTAHALEKIIHDFTQSDRFGRKNHRQVMLLLTDGKSDDSDLIAENAQAVRDLNVTTFAVGVGRAKMNELREIATGNTNSKKRVFSVGGFKDLGTIVSQLQTRIQSFVLEGAGNSLSASYSMELGEIGFSASYTRRVYFETTYCNSTESLRRGGYFASIGVVLA